MTTDVAMDDGLSIQMISHALRVRDLGCSQQWYEQTLGLSEVYRDPGYRLVTLARGRELLLTLYQTPDGGPPAQTAGEGGAYLVFIVEDMNRARATLAQRGAAPGPLLQRNGHCVCYIADPDGHQSAVVQILPD